MGTSNLSYILFPSTTRYLPVTVSESSDRSYVPRYSFVDKSVSKTSSKYLAMLNEPEEM